MKDTLCYPARLVNIVPFRSLSNIIFLAQLDTIFTDDISRYLARCGCVGAHPHRSSSLFMGIAVILAAFITPFEEVSANNRQLTMSYEALPVGRIPHHLKGQ